jgi:hypothetical protein
MKLSELDYVTLNNDDILRINALDFVEYKNNRDKERAELHNLRIESKSMMQRVEDLRSDKNSLYKRNAELLHKLQVLEAKIEFYEMEKKHIYLDLKA